MSDVSATPVTEAPGIFGLLEKRRAQIENEQVLAVEVPRWNNPKLVIKFKPVPHESLKRGAIATERAMKDGDAKKLAEVELNTNAALLVEACISITAILGDGTECGMGVDGALTRFDADLAIALGMPESSTHIAVCRNLFIADGDLLLTSKKLGEWSGYRTDSIEEAIVGES